MVTSVTPNTTSHENEVRAGRETEFELKFAVKNAIAPAMLPWLHAFCRPHPEYPEALITSVYYDTSDWRLLNEKVGSDFLKTKVRLRWYGDVRTGAPGGPAFVEAKLKTGTQRRKIRVGLQDGAQRWAETPLDDARFEEPLMALQEQGLTGLQRLRPAFQLEYRRFRFVHPFSSSILCLDTDIHVARAHPGRFRHARPDALVDAVLEQKGPLDRLDPLFEALERFGPRKIAFSKYQHCFYHITGLFP
jgi:hypothetical protein